MSILEKFTGIITGKHASNEVNFSELVILATVGKKLESDASGKNNLPAVADCVFRAVTQESMDLSYDKFKANLRKGQTTQRP